jgi:hypothetical protein
MREPRPGPEARMDLTDIVGAYDDRELRDALTAYARAVSADVRRRTAARRTITPQAVNDITTKSQPDRLAKHRRRIERALWAAYLRGRVGAQLEIQKAAADAANKS